MADTYTLISSVTVGAGGASSIDFTSIPATYTDLVVKASLRTNESPGAGWSTFPIHFNGSSTGYTQKVLFGYSTGASSISDTDGYVRVNAATTTSSTFSNTEWYIPNYAGSAYKSYSNDSVIENNSGTAYYAGDFLTAGLWSNTAAITSINLSFTSFVQYGTVYLYGIKNS